MASYFQAYFQASSMPKRLLQYALSKLEIFDTDALGLDKLDIAFGRNSTLEFRDVGLRLKKLHTLLQLPPGLEIQKARVLLLRITIPVDLFSSAIQLEVEGVEVQLFARESTDSKSRTLQKRKRPSSKSSSRTNTHGKKTESLDNTDDSAADNSLPSAVDLAQSFLQTEPAEEKADLEAAILSSTQELDPALSISEEDDSPIGTGAALSLPSFMARFLQGILDRLQVRIRDVVLNLDIDLQNDASKVSSANHPDPVTISLTVGNIDIEESTLEDNNEMSVRRAVHKLGKKLISLSQIGGTLTSDAVFFSSLSRSSALPSPLVSQSEGSEGHQSTTKSTPSLAGSMMQTPVREPSPDLPSNMLHSSLSIRSTYEAPVESQLLHDSIHSSNNGRFDDADDDVSLSDSVLDSSAYLDEVTDSRYLDENDLDDSAHSLPSRVPRADVPIMSPLATPRMPSPVSSASRDLNSNQHPAQSTVSSQGNSTPFSTVLPLKSRPRYSENRISQSQPSLPAGLSSSSFNQTTRLENIAGGEDIAEPTTPPEAEDLTQSQLFSHEDAESMYMSAVSHTSSIARLPGGWANSSSDGGDSNPAEDSQTFHGYDESLDNLEHARHTASDDYQLEQQEASGSATPRQASSPLQESPYSQHVPPVVQSSSDTSERSATSSEDSSRLKKQFLYIDHIDIYVPSALPPSAYKDSEEYQYSSSPISKHDHSQESTARSAYMDVPGAFSTTLQQDQSTMEQSVRTPKPALGKVLPKEHEESPPEILLGHILASFDISVGRLMFRIIQQLKESMKSPSAPSPDQQTTSDKSFVLSVEKFSIEFLERLEGTLGTDNTPSVTLTRDVLLQTTLSDLHVNHRVSTSTSTSSVTLGKFTFGYAKENIVSFDAGLQVRSSVRDLKASDGIDLSLEIIHSADVTRYEVTTLPVHVSIDLRRLDETFSWFGGLSSVLNLGSSIASTATITTSPTITKPRGVRFEAPIRPDDKSIASQNKANVRIGGFDLTLLGTECSVRLETSKIKAVSRDEGVGLSVHKIRLSGPHLRDSVDEAPINVDVTSARLEYLTTPSDPDLERLLALITPSKAKYDQDDDILIETLLRQRKQGGLVRLTIDDVQARIGQLQDLAYLPDLGEEISRLATVAKYLPDDDRPGLLSLVTLRKFEANVDIGNALGAIQLSLSDVELAQITLPALIAASVGGISARRNASEVLLEMATDPETRELRARSPMIMARMIGDEMDPVIRVKIWNLRIEYRVPTLMVLLALLDTPTIADMSASLTASVDTLKQFVQPDTSRATRQVMANDMSRSMAVDVVLRDCIIGLNPLHLPSKLLFVMTEAHLNASVPKNSNAKLTYDLGKGSILIVDDIASLSVKDDRVRIARDSFDGGSAQVADLCATGYVSVSYISSARAIVQATMNEDGERSIDVELRDDLFVLETCADSTQTLIAILGALSPPTPPSRAIKYRTKVIPVHDLLASLSGDAFGTAEGQYDIDDDFGIPESFEDELVDEDGVDLDFDSQYYQNQEDNGYGETASGTTRLSTRDTPEGVLLESFVEAQKEPEIHELQFEENHFGTRSILEGTAHRWNSARNTYDTSNATRVRQSPLKVCVRDVHIIWNLFDGYDWQHTRDTITKAVHEVEAKASDKRALRTTFDQDLEDDETVIGDFLFNSIYIGIPANRDPRELSAAINQELNDNATETESVATTSLTTTTTQQSGGRRVKSKKLRLNRSKHHKIAFEVRGVNVDMVTFPPGSGETQSSVDIRVKDLEIFDHIPTSTWRKFATYMSEEGEREMGRSMVHIEILNVKPILELAASEIVLKVTVLPLRLHVDQDALDFITRFFEFKDDITPKNDSPSDVPFIQRAEVNNIKVKLDFKPKRVDYAGLRSGHTTEFMNFLILQEANMTLRHTIIHGISGFDKLGKCLNDVWMPDIKRNQLPGILAGIAPIRSIVDVGGGIRELFVVPIREYKKDGRIVRGISKGAAAFAKTTGTELVRLGAKVAIGVQTVLQGAEDFLGPGNDVHIRMGEDPEEERRQISLYANQPIGVLQGLRGGYSSLQRDLLTARDAIIAVPGEVMESGNAAGVLRAMRKHAPTVILRPAIGVAKAGGQILMGATNTLDPVNLHNAENKYKNY